MTEEKKKEIISHLGECIFPQRVDLIFNRFGEDILSLVADGYISTSRSKVGAHPTMMKMVKGYIELTNKGWEYYQLLNSEQNDEPSVATGDAQ